MAQGTQQNNSVIIDLQSKHGDSSAAFFLPFLDRQMTLYPESPGLLLSLDLWTRHVA
jgi:hypothetical protein